MHSSSWNIRFNASHSGSYFNALDLHPNVPPSDGKMAQYAPLHLLTKNDVQLFINFAPVNELIKNLPSPMVTTDNLY